jgi:hypothetical protein
MLEVMDRQGIAEALKARRARLGPADVGVPAGLRRASPRTAARRSGGARWYLR